MIERELRVPIAKWLLARGLIPVCEVHSLGNCDMVGFELQTKPFRALRMVAIELKLTAVAGVIRQCRSHLERANETYAAMPPVSAKSVEKFRAAGIGLLKVEGNSVSVVLPAIPRDVVVSRWTKVAARRREEYKGRLGCPEFLRQPKGIPRI